MKIYYFGALWCPSCLIMRPIWRKVAAHFEMELIEFDYDFNEEEVESNNVSDKLPTCIIKDNNGIELTRIIGEKKQEKIIEIIEKLIKGE